MCESLFEGAAGELTLLSPLLPLETFVAARLVIAPLELTSLDYCPPLSVWLSRVLSAFKMARFPALALFSLALGGAFVAAQEQKHITDVAIYSQLVR